MNQLPRRPLDRDPQTPEGKAEQVETGPVAAREEVSQLLADAEGRGLRIIDEAKSRAIEEANKIISGAKAEAEEEAIRRGMDFGGTRVQRVIEFPPELKQAGIGILSYFSEVLKQRYPAHEMAVRIEQFGTKVRLTVDSPSGWRDTIEHDLETYGRVVVGKYRLLPCHGSAGHS